MEGGCWFEHDMPLLMSGSPESWWNRLAGVALTLVSQWVLIHCGYSPPGGGQVPMNSNSCRNLIMHVPTPAATDGNWPSFPMEDSPLAQWMDYASQDEREPPTHPTPQSTAVDVLERSSITLTDELHGLLPSHLKSLAETSNNKTLMRLDEVREAMNVADLPPLPFDQLLNPTSIPAAPVYGPLITPTDYTYINGNSETKVAITLALAEAQKKGW